MINIILNTIAIFFVLSTIAFFTLGLWALLGSDKDDEGY
jgi:hypothetical protein